MKILPICLNYNKVTAPQKTSSQNNNTQSTPALVKYMDCVNFTASDTLKVQDISFDYYKNMSEYEKKIMRKKCERFNKKMEASELFNEDKKYLPLMNDEVMEQYLKVCEEYCKLKDEKIICLGRSPKWFLDTARWMKGGLYEKPRHIAFSKNWYRYEKTIQDYVKMDWALPTPEEKQAYKSYLKTMRTTPQDIVKYHEKTGKKVIITDYITSGKGACSFLDLMSEFAEEEGILEEFANSISIFGIGSMEYQETFHFEDENISEPFVPMPERLWKYENIIPQRFYNMPYNVFDQMLLNENTNECRSTYYPHEAWTLYKPYNFKTGQVSTTKINELTKNHGKHFTNFNPTMRDFRNLLTFRIIDYLAEHDRLRDSRTPKYKNHDKNKINR